MARRFLLDQGFPKPVVDVHGLDESVRYEHLSDFAPELSNVSTPDWLVYLAATEAGFDGVVTRDQSQIEQREELVVLDRSDLSVVTWRKGLDDPVTEWGLLVAYMPLIIKRVQAEGPAIFLLPKPNLDSRSVINKHQAAYELAQAAERVERRAESIQKWPFDEGTFAWVIGISTGAITIALSRVLLIPFGI